MTPRLIATIAVRIIALLIVIWALFDVAKLVFVLPGNHPAVHATNPIIAPSFDRTPKSSPILSFFRLEFPFIAIRFLGGLLLFFVSKPVGKLVAQGLE